jgi:preprotein translocase subunit SecG
VLTRTTAFLAAAFFATSLVLSILAGFHRNPSSILQPAGGSTTSSPGAPTPPSGGTGGLLEQLEKQEQAPATPQVPQSR